MKFVLFIYETPSEFAARTDPKRADAYWGAYKAYFQALAEGGVATTGSALQPPSTAATVRVPGGERRVQDGPFADTKEQLGGYFVIDVPDLDVALQWAARCPSTADGSVEVRPLLEM